MTYTVMGRGQFGHLFTSIFMLLVICGCLIRRSGSIKRRAQHEYLQGLNEINDATNYMSTLSPKDAATIDGLLSNSSERRSLFGRLRGSSPSDDDSYLSHRVKNLPGLPVNSDLVSYAGHIKINKASDSNIFYWLFEHPSVKAKKKWDPSIPLIIWLNGGPGCSSMDGLFLELGPIKLSSDFNIKINPYSWHNIGHLLFIDQPVGTGFSYTKQQTAYPSNDKSVNRDFILFLEGFFKLHKRFTLPSSYGNVLKTIDMYLTGESHAGHYILSVSKEILIQNDALISKASNIDDNSNSILYSVKGTALGNPWIDPMIQYDASDIAYGLGLISEPHFKRLKKLEAECQSLLELGRLNNNVCFALLDRVIDSTKGIYPSALSKKVLMYDARKFVLATSEFPPGHETVENYLNKVEVRQALHTVSTPHAFKECTDPPYMALSHQDGKGVMPELQFVLDYNSQNSITSKIKVLIFAGQYDLICNHVGLEKALFKFNWTKASNWRTADLKVFYSKSKSEDIPAGYIQEFDNLLYIRVSASGHMVPLDQPEVALDMIKRFVSDSSLVSSASSSNSGGNSNSNSNSNSESSKLGSLLEIPTDKSYATTYKISLNEKIRRNNNRIK